MLMLLLWLRKGRREEGCLLQAEGDRLTAERIMLHKSRADMAAQLARLKAIQVSTLPLSWLACLLWLQRSMIQSSCAGQLVRRDVLCWLCRQLRRVTKSHSQPPHQARQHQLQMARQFYPMAASPKQL